MVASSKRRALIHERHDAPEPSLADLLARMAPVALVLVEGFKRDDHPKLEIWRRSNGKPLLCHEDPHIVAAASDEPVDGLPVPRLDLNDPDSLARFIIGHCGL